MPAHENLCHMPDERSSTLSQREACQCLRNAALGTARLEVRGHAPHGRVLVDIDDWQLTLEVDVQGLARCVSCRCPEGRLGTQGDWGRYGTDPVDLLSIWERGRLEQLLREATTG